METRVAVISLIVTQPEAVEELNAILHTYVILSAAWACPIARRMLILFALPLMHRRILSAL